WPADRAAARGARRSQAEVVREVIGNPFRPWRVVGGWLDPAARIGPDGVTLRVPDAARHLAGVVDRDGAYDRLPILADALEDAGWADAGVLDHCRHGRA